MRSQQTETKPTKSAIARAMQSPQGQAIANRTATTLDWITVILYAEAIAQTDRIIATKIDRFNKIRASRKSASIEISRKAVKQCDCK